MTEFHHSPKARFPYASRIDEEGRLLIPPVLRDLHRLAADMDVTLSEGRDGFVVILPAKLATAEDIAYMPTETPPTLREASVERLQHLLEHVDAGSIAASRLLLSLGTRRDELAYTLGCEQSGQGEQVCSDIYRHRLHSCLTIIGMHDTYMHEGPRPSLAGDGELIDSYA